MKIKIETPDNCKDCGFENFNIWGTKINGVTRIEVRCMRCGSVNFNYPQSKHVRAEGVS